MSYIEKYRKGLVCLVPREGAECALTCHEKTLCDCQVLEIFAAYDRAIKDAKYEWHRNLTLSAKLAGAEDDIRRLGVKLNIAIEAINSMRRIEARKMMIPEITILSEQALKRISSTTEALNDSSN